MKVLKPLLTAAFLCAATFGSASAQELGNASQTAGLTPVTDIVRIKKREAPRLDGIVDDAVWDRAQVVTGLHQLRPDYRAPATDRTEIFLLFDKHNLYVGARLYMDRPDQLMARGLTTNAIGVDDTFEMTLSPFNDQRSGYFFQINANGVRKDALYEGVGDRNWNWDAIWYANAAPTDYGWAVEIAIPFKSLNFDPRKEAWGINFSRDHARKREDSAWSSYQRRTMLDSLGEVRGLTGLKQGLGLDIVPGLTMSGTKDRPESVEDFGFKPSLDVFYKFKPTLTAVLTLNTDFSATEVDGQVVNLSRFSVFLPEKRDFFLQDSDLFTFGDIRRNGQPFFSRRIGLDEDREAVPLRVGAKVAGRIGDLNIGLMDIVQERGDHGGHANIFVGRLAWNASDAVQVGGIVTHGDPITGEGRYTVGFDASYRDRILPGDRTLSAAMWVQQTHTGGVDANQGAFGFSVSAPSATGYRGSLYFNRVGENYDPALGYVNRPGTRQLSTRHGYNWLFSDHDWLRSLGTGVGFTEWRNSEGEMESRGIELELIELEANTGDELRFEIGRDWDVLDEPFELADRVEISEGRYSGNRWTLVLDTSSQRMAGIYLRYGESDFYDGTRKSLGSGVRVTTSKHFTLRGSFSQNEIDTFGVAFTTRQYSVRADLAFDVRWSWLNTLQYNNVSEKIAINSRLRYERRPGQDFYLVVNHGLQRDDVTDRFESTVSTAALKLGYTFRF